MKNIAMVLIIALFAALGVAEAPADEIYQLECVVLETLEDGYMAYADELGEIKILADAETVIETNAEISCGDLLYIDYDGAMTRSLPPQITADVIRMYRAEGDVIELYPDDNAMLVDTMEFGEILVNLPEEMRGQEFTETHITVWFNGAMTMSLPAQIGAGKLVAGYSLRGIISEITDEYIMIGEGMSAYQVNTANCTLPGDIAVGTAVQVIFDGQMTRSIPAQVNADSVTIIGAAE